MNLLELGALASATIALITVLSKLLSIVTRTYDTVKEINHLSTNMKEQSNSIKILTTTIKELSSRVSRIENFLSNEFGKENFYRYGA